MSSFTIQFGSVPISFDSSQPVATTERAKTAWETKFLPQNLVLVIDKKTLSAENKDWTICVLAEAMLNSSAVQKSQFYNSGYGSRLALDIYEYACKRFQATEQRHEQLFNFVNRISELIRCYSLRFFHDNHFHAHKLLDQAIALANHQAILDKAGLLKQEKKYPLSAQYYLCAIKNSPERKGLEFNARYIGIVSIITDLTEKGCVKSSILKSFADEGIPSAQFHYGRLLEQENMFTEAYQYLSKASQHCEPHILGLLANYLLEGAAEVQKSYPKNQNFCIFIVSLVNHAAKTHGFALELLAKLAKTIPLAQLHYDQFIEPTASKEASTPS